MIIPFRKNQPAKKELLAPVLPGDSRFNIHLQWFAAEDEGRTEEATEHKKRKAREDGKVAKSQDVTSAIVLVFCIVALALLGPYLLASFQEMLRFFYSMIEQPDLYFGQILASLFGRYFIKLALPVVSIAFVGALIGNILQVGFLFSTKPITPDFQKIIPNFGKFFQRSFMSGEAAFNLMKQIVKLAIIGVIAFVNIRSQIEVIVYFLFQPILASFSHIAGIVFRIMIQVALVMLAFSGFDYWFQRRQHMESLKMSKQEIKEERKMMDGDPLVKGRLRQRMQQILSENMMQAVPQADVVVTNPTHFAVAMEWKQEKMTAPTVVAKGQDNIAFRIREIATDNGIPIIENKPLARALYAEVEIGDEIPEDYYEVMAIVLSQVYSMNGSEGAAV